MNINKSIEYAKLNNVYFSEKSFPIDKQYTKDELLDIWISLRNENAMKQLPKTEDIKLLLLLARIVNSCNGDFISLEFNPGNGYTIKSDALTCTFRFGSFNDLVTFEQKWEKEIKLMYEVLEILS